MQLPVNTIARPAKVWAIPLRGTACICLLAVLVSSLPNRPARAADFKFLRWEVIETTCPAGLQGVWTDCGFTERLKVPGGWLVRSTRLTREQATHVVTPGFPGGPSGSYTTGGSLGVGVGLTFLSDPNHTWDPSQ